MIKPSVRNILLPSIKEDWNVKFRSSISRIISPYYIEPLEDLFKLFLPKFYNSHERIWPYKNYYSYKLTKY
jgi:hypothetical protein